MSMTTLHASLLTSGEKLYSPAALAKASRVPGHRGAPHLNASTIFRFITKGKSVNGEVIRLEAVRAGDRWLSSVEALNRFFERLTAAAIPTGGDADAAPELTPKQRQRAARAASTKADAIFGKQA